MERGRCEDMAMALDVGPKPYGATTKAAQSFIIDVLGCWMNPIDADR
jgi:hypothetical protein